MKDKKTFYTELSYLLGILILALDTAFMERADFGVSMVVAPAYILHLKISQILQCFRRIDHFITIDHSPNSFSISRSTSSTE